MSNEKSAAHNVWELLGYPALMVGENGAVYIALRDEIWQTIEPKNILDELLVKEVTDKIWEAHRYKRFAARLIEASRVEALSRLLMPLLELDYTRANALARDYFCNDMQKTQRVEKLLAAQNITDDMICAKALAMQCTQMAFVDRMISNRETSRNGLLKDHQRRQRRAEKAKGHGIVSQNALELDQPKQLSRAREASGHGH